MYACFSLAGKDAALNGLLARLNALCLEQESNLRPHDPKSRALTY